MKGGHTLSTKTATNAKCGTDESASASLIFGLSVFLRRLSCLSPLEAPRHSSQIVIVGRAKIKEKKSSVTVSGTKKDGRTAHWHLSSAQLSN